MKKMMNFHSLNKDILRLTRGLKLALLMIMMLWSVSGFATHIVGGDLSYKCLGNDQYEVTLMFYRDCLGGNPEADFDDPASIAIYDSKNNLQVHLGQLGQILIKFNADDTLRQESDCFMDGNGVCVHRTIYRKVVQLPFLKGGYTLAYQRCCRNASLSNIVEPLETGATFITQIKEEALASCNSAPEFREWPPIFICVNEELSYDHSAMDQDGDSLVYRLCTPYTGASKERPIPQPASRPPYDEVVYKSPYNLENLLGGVPLSIDQQGILSGTPNTIGQFLVGICVDEYRNGQVIGTTRRDFEYNVVDCDNLLLTGFMVDTNTVCADVVDVTVRDNSMGVPENAAYMYTVTSDKGWEMKFNEPDFEIQTNGAQTLTITQSVTIPDVCTTNKTQTITLDVDDTGLGFLDTIVICEGSSVALNPNYNDRYIYSWSPTTYLMFADGPNPIAEPEESILYTATVFDPVLNCTITESVFLEVIANPGVTAGFDVQKECNSLTLNFINTSTGADTFIWTFGDPTNPGFVSTERDPVYTYPSGGTYDVVLTIPGDDCNTIRTKRLAVTGDDFMDFEKDIYNCGPSLIDLNTMLNPLYIYRWEDNPLISDINAAVPEAYVREDASFRVTVIDPLNDTCTIEGIINVQIDDQLVVDLGDTLLTCEPGPVQLNPNGNPSLIYMWSPAELLDDPTSYNPTANITEETRFVAKITDPNDSTCMVRIPLVVKFGIDDGGFEDGDTLIICDSSSFFINPGADPNLVYMWTPVEGLDDPTSPNPIASPLESTSYTVVVTDSMGICSLEKTIHIIIVDSEVYVDFDKFVMCNSLTVMFLNQSRNATTFQWTFGDPTNPDFVSTEENPTYTYPAMGTYDVELRSMDDQNCLAVRAMRVTLTGEDPDLIITDSMDMLCPGDTVTFSANTEFVDTFTWCDPNGVVIGTEATIMVPVFISGYYRLKASMGECDYVDSVYIGVRTLQFMLSKDLPICADEPIDITIINNTDFQIDSIVWEPMDDIVIGQGNEQITVRPQETSTYTATVVFEDGCVITDSVTVEVSDGSRFMITVDPDTIFFGESSTLTVTFEEGATYSWTPSDVLQTPNSNTTVAVPDQTTKFTVNIVDASGCEFMLMDSVVVINVQCEPPFVFLPNAFSPNGDNENDVLFVRGRYIEEMELVIYNRWGEKVFESNNPSDGWDGTFKGKLLAPDVYGYYLRILCIGGDQHVEKGNVTILH